MLAYDALQLVFLGALVAIIGLAGVFTLYLVGRFFVNPARRRHTL